MKQGRAISLPTDRDVSLVEIGTGILFVWAAWSGPARVAFAVLGEVLSRTDFESLPLYIADIDAESTQRFMASVDATPHGAGETFWIGEGKIVERLSNYTSRQQEILVRNSRELLSKIKAGH